MDPLTIWTALQNNPITAPIIEFFVERGAKALGRTFSSPTSKKAIQAAARTVEIEFGIDSFDYFLVSKVFQSDFRVTKLESGFRTQKDKWLRTLQKALVDEGFDLKGTHAQALCSRFLECYALELQKAEGLTASEMEMNAAQIQHHSRMEAFAGESRQDLKDIKELIKTVSLALPAPLTAPKIEIPGQGENPLEKEYTESKYKREFDRAKVLMDASHYEDAKKIYLDVLDQLRLDAHPPVIARFLAHTNVGACHSNLGDREADGRYKAVDHFKVALDIILPLDMPDRKKIAYRNRALACVFEGKPEHGLPFIDQALAISRDDESIGVKSKLLTELGRPDEALRLYSEDLEGQQNDTN